MTIYAQPGTEGSVVSYKERYENWIGGEWVPPVKGQYFENPSPVTGKVFASMNFSTVPTPIGSGRRSTVPTSPRWAG